MDCSVLLRKTSIGHWFDSGSGDFFAHRAVLFCAPFPHVIHAVSARAGCRLDGTAQPIKPQRSWQARNADSVSMPAGRWLTSSPRLHALSRAKNGLAWRPRRRRWASSTATDPRPSPGSSRGRGPLSRPPRRSPRGAARLPRSRPATPRPSLGRRAAEADPWPQPRAQPPRRPGSPGPRRSASRRSFPHAPLTAPRQRAPRRGRPAASPVVIPRPRPPASACGEGERGPPPRTRPRHSSGDHRLRGQVRVDARGGCRRGRGFHGEGERRGCQPWTRLRADQGRRRLREESHVDGRGVCRAGRGPGGEEGEWGPIQQDTRDDYGGEEGGGCAAADETAKRSRGLSPQRTNSCRQPGGMFSRERPPPP